MMTKDALKWLTIVVVFFGLNAAGQSRDLDEGKREFQASCSSCHGTDGKGNGPVAAQLKVAPADLTVLAKRNSGVFPVKSVYEVVDGRRQVEAHGTREMPIWGFRFMSSPYDAVNPSTAAEVTIRARILGIIDYLNRIQQK